ncbi:hypothetical protein RRF57_009731 [Xylaria bambusicola]|uniref:Uncharacterized protein n=1 Tax=Xylaria bambusicola TaxID=326684 RepID=A0AAN7URD5_9PEZI
MGDIPNSCDLNLEALENAEGSLNLRLEYPTHLYSSENMNQLLDNFLTFLTSCIKDHRQLIQEIEVCGPQDLAYLTVAIGVTGTLRRS